MSTNNLMSKGSSQYALATWRAPSYREKAAHRRCASWSSTTSWSNDADAKSDMNWAIDSHLVRPTILSVHSVQPIHTGVEPSAAPAEFHREEQVRQQLISLAVCTRLQSHSSQKEEEKARSRWVHEWLTAHYAFDPRDANATVGRRAMYACYARSFEEYGIKCLNSASFGKSVKAAFRGIKTRRLGSRGMSQYHYVGLTQTLQPQYGPLPDELRIEDTVRDSQQPFEETEDAYAWRSWSSSNVDSSYSTTDDEESIRSGTSQPIHLEAPSHGPWGSSLFWSAFCDHRYELLRHFEQGNLDRYETTARYFWSLQASSPELDQAIGVAEDVVRAYSETYNAMVSMSLPAIFRPADLVNAAALRRFAQCLETAARVSLAGFQSSFSRPLVELAARLGHLIVRVCDLQQVATALWPILLNKAQVGGIIRAWDEVDINAIVDHAALTSNCRPEALDKYLSDVGDILASRSNDILRELGDYLQQLVDFLVKTSGLESREVLLRVHSVTSQITRDLTLRSDPAFGPIQLMKTWIEDWCGLVILKEIVLGDPPYTAAKVGGPIQLGLRATAMHITTDSSAMWRVKQESNAEFALTPRGPVAPVETLELLQLG